MSRFTTRGGSPASVRYGERFKNLPVHGAKAFRRSILDMSERVAFAWIGLIVVVTIIAIGSL